MKRLLLILSIAVAVVGCADENVLERGSERLLTDLEARATRGEVAAQYQLGFLYAHGEGGVPQRFEVARDWLSRAAARGHLNAQYQLARLFDNSSFGVLQDPHAAAYWYRRAANQGHTDAQYRMGMRHADGVGVVQDDGLARDWLEQAALRDHPGAQYALSLLHLEGRGGPFDPVIAQVWATLALDNGETRARRLLAEIAPLLRPREQAEAERLVARWRDSRPPE